MYDNLIFIVQNLQQHVLG